MFFSSSASFFDMSKMYLKIYNILSSNHRFMNKAQQILNTSFKAFTIS